MFLFQQDCQKTPTQHVGQAGKLFQHWEYILVTTYGNEGPPEPTRNICLFNKEKQTEKNILRTTRQLVPKTTILQNAARVKDNQQLVQKKGGNPYLPNLASIKKTKAGNGGMCSSFSWQSGGHVGDDSEKKGLIYLPTHPIISYTSSLKLRPLEQKHI